MSMYVPCSYSSIQCYYLVEICLVPPYFSIPGKFSMRNCCVENERLSSVFVFIFNAPSPLVFFHLVMF